MVNRGGVNHIKTSIGFLGWEPEAAIALSIAIPGSRSISRSSTLAIANWKLGDPILTRSGGLWMPPPGGNLPPILLGGETHSPGSHITIPIPVNSQGTKAIAG